MTPEVAPLTAALAYARRGLSVIPLRPGDKAPPLLEWGDHQHRRATEHEIRDWWGEWPTAGIGLVCGAVSSLAVLDIDPRNRGDESIARYRLPLGPTVASGGGGAHAYFALSGETVPKIQRLLPGVDLLGTGSYAAAPPTQHPSGARYAWIAGRALGEVPLPGLPWWLRTLIQDHRARTAARDGESDGAGLSLELGAVLNSLAGVRRGRGGWSALCPAHADHHPSLSVGVGRDGRVLLHCFSGCPFRAIVAALPLADPRPARP